MPAEVSTEDEEDYEGAPWHFKLLLIALVIYLAFRLVQLIIWAAGKLF